MTRMAGYLSLVSEGFDEFRASFESIGEAGQNAHMDDMGAIVVNGELCFEGMALHRLVTRQEPGRLIIAVKSTPALILYIGWLMTKLPGHATVTYRDGWPIIHCPPRDDRDHEDGPAPRVPGHCVPA